MRNNIAVVGSRGFKNYKLLQKELQQLKPSRIITGGAYGADAMAANFAKENNISLLVFKPDYKNYGRKAPILRNIQILQEAKFLLAFWDGKSSGTHHTILKAKIFRIPYKVIRF